MAVDHALALTTPAGQAVLRLYSWASPTISFGRNEPARDRYPEGALQADGLEAVRRPTGGRSVLHARERTYSVAVDSRVLGGPRAAYCAFSRGLAGGLQSLGVGASVVPDGEGEVVPPDSGPCFAVPAPGEVSVGGRKLIGSAQARIGSNLMQHGSVLLEDDQGMLERWDPRGGAVPATSLTEVLQEVPGEEVLDQAIVAGLREELGGSGWGASELPSDAAREAERLLERYRSREWTWRR